MRANQWGFLFILMFLLSWVACRPSAEKSEAFVPDASHTKRDCKPLQAGPHLEVELAPLAAGIGRHRLTILAKDADSNLFVELESLQVVPWMLLHGHGAPEKPEVKRIFKGKSEVFPIHFSMSGEWLLEIRATARKGSTVLCMKVDVSDVPVKGGVAPPKKTIPSDSTPPVLGHSVIALDGSFVPASRTLNRLLCDKSSDSSPCLVPFLLGSGESFEQAGFLTFVTSPGASVYATTSGVVELVQFVRHSQVTHSDIFRLVTRANKDNAFWIEYRNLKGVRVKVGEQVRGGQVLAEAGDTEDREHARVSFGVRRSQESEQRLCPELFFSSEVKVLYGRVIDELKRGGVLGQGWALCESKALVCKGAVCEKPSDFVAVRGDVDAGRRDYKGACASCHGERGEGGIGRDLCKGTGCKCLSCAQTHALLSRRIATDMPPEGSCVGRCAEDVAAYIMHSFVVSGP